MTDTAAPPRTRRRRAIAIVAGVLALAFHVSSAGADPSPADTCTYRGCALDVVPAWNGLDLVKGEREESVGRLGFLWTRDVSPAFAGEPLAIDLAHRAVRTRRMAAIFTDAGGALLVTALAGGLAAPEHSDRWRAIAIGGGAAFAVSVPLQFAADGHLARAVWRFNARFAR